MKIKTSEEKKNFGGFNVQEGNNRNELTRGKEKGAERTATRQRKWE